MYKAIKEFTITQMLMKNYLNPHSEDYVKTEKCGNCSTIYILNPESSRYHKNCECTHLRPGYKFFKKK